MKRYFARGCRTERMNVNVYQNGLRSVSPNGELQSTKFNIKQIAISNRKQAISIQPSTVASGRNWNFGYHTNHGIFCKYDYEDTV